MAFSHTGYEPLDDVKRDTPEALPKRLASAIIHASNLLHSQEQGGARNPSRGSHPQRDLELQASAGGVTGAAHRKVFGRLNAATSGTLRVGMLGFGKMPSTVYWS